MTKKLLTYLFMLLVLFACMIDYDDLYNRCFGEVHQQRLSEEQIQYSLNNYAPTYIDNRY